MGAKKDFATATTKLVVATEELVEEINLLMRHPGMDPRASKKSDPAEMRFNLGRARVHAVNVVSRLKMATAAYTGGQ